MEGDAFVVEVSAEGLEALVRALRAEEDGKRLRRDLAKGMRQALQPTVEAVRGAAGSLPASGRSHGGGSLRGAIQKAVKAETRLSGRTTGARIKVRKTPGTRGFANAPMRENRAAGWRHPVWSHAEQGHSGWAHQYGRAHWFDDTTLQATGAARAAVEQAMEDMARRIASRH
jgi:hypothetical protein